MDRQAYRHADTNKQDKTICPFQNKTIIQSEKDRVIDEPISFATKCSEVNYWEGGQTIC